VVIMKTSRHLIILFVLSVIVGCSSSKEYPLCNVKCPEGTKTDGLNCKVTPEDLSGIRKLANKVGLNAGTEVIQIAAGLVLISTNATTHRELEENWEVFACPTIGGQLQPVQGRAYSLCAGAAKEWLSILRNGKTSDLVSETKFRSVCLGYQ